MMIEYYYSLPDWVSWVALGVYAWKVFQSVQAARGDGKTEVTADDWTLAVVWPVRLIVGKIINR
jgi:hypothetical protein